MADTHLPLPAHADRSHPLAHSLPPSRSLHLRLLCLILPSHLTFSLIKTPHCVSLLHSSPQMRFHSHYTFYY
ncbi:hypothetical protein E2C01_057199 [Portunus trituberculatus]|uniref:Uncharacterized protein n=1 Tax=Portunus trituberculatus TaxID=210409 RepID=A0A5B7H0F3_PORTR|nr:hypothetical protein [Portunus trituberculatus]